MLYGVAADGAVVTIDLATGKASPKSKLDTMLSPGALFDIDSTGSVLKQASPNDGVLNTVGSLGMVADAAAFDILSDGNGGNTGWLMAGDTLYRVDLGSGRGTEAGKIPGVSGPVRDIAVLPRM